MQKMLKTVISFLLIFSLIGTFTVASEAWVSCDHQSRISDSRKEGIYTYTFNEEGATITAIDGKLSGKITVPNMVAGKTVIGIGQSLFRGNTEITEVVLPENLKIIEAYAFEGCTAIKTVNIPDGVTRICYKAFEGCSALYSVKLPSAVKTIEDSVFKDCTSLADIDIPDGVIELVDGSFHNTAIYNNEENWENGVLYVDQFLYEAKSTVSGKYIVKNGTKHIKIRAFENNKEITEIVLPDGLETVGFYAFYECSNLEKVNIPVSVKEIGGFAFFGTKIKEIHFPQSNTVVLSGAFQNCRELTSVTLPSEISEIWSSLFEGCEKLESISIPDSVTVIGLNAFAGTKYRVNKMNENGGVFYVNNILCEADKKLSGDYSVKEGTVSICERAFLGCEKLTSVSFPDSVKEIGALAFSGCSELTEFTFPDLVTKINSNLFYNCKKLESVNIHKDVTDIDSDALSAPDLKNINIDKDNPNYSADGLILFNKDKTELIMCYDRDITSYEVPDTVKIIRSESFSINTLTDISLPEGIETIEAEAFTFSGYYNINENWENDMLYIGNYLISSRVKETAKIKDGTVLIADEAFLSCYLLNEITIPSSVKHVGSHVFNSCQSLKKIIVLSPDTSFGCHALTTNYPVEICGYKGSTAEGYCTEYNKTFISIGSINGLAVKDPSLVKDTGSEVVLISEKMSVKVFIDAIISDITITDSNGNILKNDDIITNGIKITVKDKDNKIVAEKTVVILGDVDDDGKITASDARSALRASVGLEKLSLIQQCAANIDTSDVKISAGEARIILRASVGLENMKEILRKL